jgi:hypothetical protein
MRGRPAENRGAAADNNFSELDFKEIMARSLESAESPPEGGAGQSPNRLPFAMAQIPAEFDDNVSRNGQLTRV